MYKLIALDMDGTLLNSQGQISPPHAAIAAARAKGVTVVLASGRPLEDEPLSGGTRPHRSG